MKLNNYEIEHNRVIRSQAAECALFLKRNNDFPLTAPCKIALYGNGARRTIKGGTGSGDVNVRTSVSVEKGLENAGFTITTKAWLDAYDAAYIKAREAFISEIKTKAKKLHTNAIMLGMGAVMPEPSYKFPLNGEGDTAVYVLSRICGEGNDRQNIPGDMKLSDTELRDILSLSRQYEKFMLVLNVGGMMDLSSLLDEGDEAPDNILLLSQLGAQTGDIFADILLGKADPSGKLASTWSPLKDFREAGTFGDADETYYNEGIYVGYRYFDSTGKKAVFPFGFGLSYTDFQISPGGVFLCEGSTVENGPEILVTASVANIGAYPGKAVAELYVSSPEGTLDQPYQALAAFTKTEVIQPGRFENVGLRFLMRDIASYDTASASWILEAGDYIIRLGKSSTDTEIVGIIRLQDTVITEKVKNACGTPGFTDWKPETKRTDELPENVRVLSLSKDLFHVNEVRYDAEEEIAPEVEALNDSELAYLLTGAFDPKGGALSIVGNVGLHVAGAAGESTSLLEKKGFRPLVMADGPAGLRISSRYFRDKKGEVHAMDGGVAALVGEYLPKAAVKVLSLLQKKPGKNDRIQEQYATSIPIGTAIAQSWNPAFARNAGDIVGSEMVRFGIDLWLAPALNIHRDPRCGRNFEYYSEDPLLSGCMAAAITKGVQSHLGRGVTIKHYAANNQETNRFGNNSNVSERAMREIYLRGFGICIKEARPLAVMSSYNLLNGVHTSERGDLGNDILRAEFGFHGILMTDWIVRLMMKGGKYGPPDAWKIIAAGGDIVMPGSKEDHESILNAIKEKRLSRKTAMTGAMHLYKLINSSEYK